jgi:hypothetical protein
MRAGRFFPAFPREEFPVSETARNGTVPSAIAPLPSFVCSTGDVSSKRSVLPLPDQVAAPPSDRNETSAPTVPVADKSSGNPFFTPRSTSSRRWAGNFAAFRFRS